METSSGCFLTDPVLFDPFEEGTVVSCPRRDVHLDHLPELRGIVVSHRHLDHFDVPSLAALDRRTPVFCPPDALVQYGLKQLGFNDLRPLEPFVPHYVDTLKLLPTPSLNRNVMECGLVFQDATGTLFNQVDTVLGPADVQRLRQDAGEPDVHLAMYASQQFGFFESKRDYTAATYAINLNIALLLGAGCVVPASAGFRFADELDWLNRHVFPIRAEQFAADLQRLRPGQRTEIVQPGDRLTMASGQVSVERQVAEYVTLLEADTHRLTYDPSAPVPPLQETNSSGYGIRGMQELVQGVLESGLPQYLNQSISSPEEVAWQYAQHGVIYQVEVVFPDDTRYWVYHFDRQHTYRWEGGPSEVAPHVRLRMTASALVDWCLGRRSYVSVRTQYRRTSRVLQPTSTERGIEVREIELPDLLSHYILNKMAGADRLGADWIDFRIRSLSRHVS
jgi:L-ascorbate metabolism protein UlaG (beta-lactamase superfamily)